MGFTSYCLVNDVILEQESEDDETREDEAVGEQEEDEKTLAQQKPDEVSAPLVAIFQEWIIPSLFSPIASCDGGEACTLYVRCTVMYP